jgi:DNA-binding MarR family transcriptional regulator
MDSDHEVCGMVIELSHRIDGHLRSHLNGFELTPSQAVAVRELGKPLTMHQLADRMSCEASNVTFVVDRLESSGLAQRQAGDGDRRVKRVSLTDAGKALRLRLMRQLAKDSPLARLTTQERRQLGRLLTKAVR